MKFFLLILYIFSFTFCIGQNNSDKIFESSKGKWKFPIQKFTQIVDNQTLKRHSVNLFDSTLTILTDSAYNVYALYDGRVIGSFEVNGEYSIVTKFGNYCIAYHRLQKPLFKKNDQVKAGQIIGQLVNIIQNEYSLELDLYYFKKISAKPVKWMEKKLSPYKWIDWTTASNN